MDRRQDLIFFSCVVREPEFHYEIYAVDLGKSISDLTTLRPKVIVYSSYSFWKLCLISCTLYLFCEDGRAASFDLSLLREDEPEPVVLDEELETLEYIATMKHRKNDLEAIPTPGGKVIAFSKRIDFRNSCDFEVYDPATGCWEDVPPIDQQLTKIRCSMGTTLRISSYTFSDDSTLVIESRSGDRFLLFLASPAWLSRWHGPLSPGEKFPFDGFSRDIVGGGYQLCLTGPLVWDIQNAGGVSKSVSRLPDFQYDPSFETESRMVISGRRASHCYDLEITKDHSQSPPHYHLRIQEFFLDLVGYFEEKKVQEEDNHKKMQKLVDGSWEQQYLLNRMMVTSPRLGWCPLRSSSFLLPSGISHRLDETTTFHQ